MTFVFVHTFNNLIVGLRVRLLSIKTRSCSWNDSLQYLLGVSLVVLGFFGTIKNSGYNISKRLKFNESVFSYFRFYRIGFKSRFRPFVFTKNEAWDEINIHGNTRTRNFECQGWSTFLNDNLKMSLLVTFLSIDSIIYNW